MNTPKVVSPSNFPLSTVRSGTRWLTKKSKCRLAQTFTLLTFALVLGLASLPGRTLLAAESPSAFNTIDAYIAAQMKEIGLPGLALGIVHGDQIVYLQGYGIASPSGRGVTAQTPFRLASLAKPVTALAIMQLVEAGKVELDAPVQRYLPYFRLTDEQAAATLAVRHLLNHTSGLSRLTGDEKFPSQAALDWTPEQRVRELRDNVLTYPAGTRYQYSNVNFVILALIVEAVSEQPFERYVQERIFTPLEMRHATYDQPAAAPPDIATGYTQWFGIPFARDLPFPRSSNGHGGLIASAEDMTHFMIAQLNEGRYRDATVLSPAGIAAMHTPPANVADTAYAMGWEVQPENGLPLITHSGDYGDFHADMTLTSDGWGIVVMTNANSLWAAGRPAGIKTGVLSLLRGQQPVANEGLLFLRVLVIGIMSIVAFQIIGMVWSWVTLWRWFQGSLTVERPRGWWRIGWRVIAPLVVNLFLGFIITVAVPALLEVSLQGLIFVYPDLGYAMAASGGVAFVWLIRTVLAYFVLRTTSNSAVHRVSTDVSKSLTV
ncbi:MAG: serine hydrolase domain-containing protein [Caldilineaceae bacterium]